MILSQEQMKLQQNKLGEKTGKKTISLFEIFILTISIVAFAYFVGEEFRLVSATDANAGTGGCKDRKFSYGGETYTIYNSGQIEGFGYDIGPDGTRINPKHYLYDKIGGVWYRNSQPPVQVDPAIEGDWVTKADECYNAVKSGTTPEKKEGEKPASTILPVGDITKTCGEQEGKPCNPGQKCDGGQFISSKDSGLCCKGGTCKDMTNEEGKYTDYNDCMNKLNNEEKCKQLFSPQGFLGLGTVFGSIVEGLLWAVGVYAAARAILPMLGAEENLVNAGSMALGLGVLVGKSVHGIIAGAKGAAPVEWGIFAGALTAAIVFALMYKKETREIITFNCLPWQAATKGDNCNKCNEQGILPCSEYQCRSLGQACELLNKGTDKEECVWVNRNDVEFPTIKPLEDALISNDYKYSPDNSISPPDRGVKIEYTPSTTKCIKAFTPLSFGITLNEPAKCKIDTSGKKSFDEMSFYFSGGLSLRNHSYALNLPGSAALKSENITVENDGNYNLYVRCQDANGNSNTANFVFKFCVEKGPDTTPPLIVTTNPLNGRPVAYNQTSFDIEVYVNEPAECKWSHLDQDYESMEGQMDCSRADSLSDVNPQGLYTCGTTLTGLKDRQENKFYFRCKDQPTAEEKNRNANRESYEFVLIGTQPLVIDWAKPETGSIIRDSTASVKVTLEAQTSAGYKDGEATCYFSDTGATEDYDMFFKTNSYQHSQELWLPGGSHEYFIKCIDLGGNSDIKTVSFTVESDSAPPIIARAYHEETYLKLVTSEKAECVYDTTDCSYNFDDGIKFATTDNIEHFTDWNTNNNFYIKCKDEFGNQPVPNDRCSIIVRPFSEY